MHARARGCMATSLPPLPAGDPATPSELAKRRWARVRLVAVLALPVVLYALGRAFDVQHRFTVDGLRSVMASAGALGMALYVVAFCAGELVQVPGLVFIAAGVLAYGRVVG